jgi:hypothetical protein
MSSITLFYYNEGKIKPFIFLVAKVSNDKDINLLEEYTENIFKILIDNQLSNESDILIINIIKEHEGKIINWILPSVKSDTKIVESIENNSELVNDILITVLENMNCRTEILLNEANEDLDICIKDCDKNLSFIADEYFF